MDYIKITKDNLDKENLCCANSGPETKGKKAWIRERLDEGLVFIKSVVRGKCFIEYIPASMAWCPIDAESYMYIDCLWVSGSFKGHGYSTDLLNMCIEDAKAKGFKGLATLSSDKKRSFLNDPRYLEKKGFKVRDRKYFFTLMTLDFEETGKAEFLQTPNAPEGLCIYWTNQCPFNARYIPLLENKAREMGIELKTMEIKTKEEALNSPCPWTTYSIFKDGEFITNQMQSEASFEKLVKTL